MADKDTGALGAEDEIDNGFLNTIKDAAVDAASFVQEKAPEALDYLQEKGGAIIDKAQDIGAGAIDMAGGLIESGVGFIQERNLAKQIEVEQSTAQYKEWVKQTEPLRNTSIFDSMADLFSGFKSEYDLSADKNIKDIEVFNQMQELRNIYQSSLAEVNQELNFIKDKEEKTKEELAQLKRLEELSSKITLEYELTEASLIDRAIEGVSEQERKDRAASIFDKLAGVGEMSNEAELLSKFSKEADAYIDGLMRKFATQTGNRSDDEISSIQSLKGTYASQYQNTKINKARAIRSALDSGMDEAGIKKIVQSYDRFEKLQEEYIAASLESASAGLTGSELITAVTISMGEADAQEMIKLENTLTSDVLLATGISNFFGDHKFVGALELAGAGIAKTISGIKTGKDILFSTDIEEKLAHDATEMLTFNQTGINKMFTWTMNNLDDLFLELGGIVGGTVVGATPFTLAGRAAGISARTTGLYKKYNTFAKNSPLAGFLLKNKFVGLENIGLNVTTGLIPNILLDTAAKDVTSESRILFGMLNDVMFGPVFDAMFDTVIGGGVRAFSKGTKMIGFIPEKKAIDSISTAFKISKTESSEMLEVIENWRTITGLDLFSDKSKIDFTKSILGDLKKSEGGLIDKDGIIARLRSDSLSAAKLDKGLSDLIMPKLKLVDIDLSKNTIEAIQVERLIKPFEIQKLNNRDTFINDVLSNLGVSKVDIQKNRAETLDVSNQLFDLAQVIQTEIKGIRTAGILTKDSLLAIESIKRYNSLVDNLATKFDKSKQYVELYLKDGRKVSMNIDDIETKGIRIRDKEDNALFRTTSIHNKLKNLEYEGLSDYIAKFIRFRGGNEGAELTQVQVGEAVSWITRLTGVKPAVIPKGEVKTFSELIGIYQDPQTGLYKIYVGGKYLQKMDFNPNQSIEIELSGSDFLQEKRRIQKANAKLDKEKQTNILKRADEETKPVEATVANSGKYKQTETIKLKAVEEKKLTTTTLVPLSREEIQEGTINKAIWNRIMLSNKEFSADEFDRIIASEAIGLKKIISTKDNVLRNAITLKDIGELKSYIRNKMKQHLTPAFNDRELNQFLGLLDETVWSTEGLNLLSKFSRSIDQEINKVDTLGNLMESLALHSAQRFKSLDLSENIIEVLSKYGDGIKARRAIADLLLGAHPVDALALVGIKGTSKKILKKIQSITGINIDNPLLKANDKHIEKFLENLVNSKIINGEVPEDLIEGYSKRTTNALLNRVINARDVYIDGIIKQVYEGNDSVSSLMTALKNNSVTKQTDLNDLDLTLALEFEEQIIKANSYEEVKKILQDKKDINITEGIRINIQKVLDSFNEHSFENIDFSIGQWVESNKKIESAYKDVSERLIKTPDDYKVFDEDGLYMGDNIVTKSLNYILNPQGKSEVFEDGIAKEISDLMDKNIFGNKNILSFHEINKKLRDENITTEDQIKYKKELDNLQDQLFIFLNPVKFTGDKLTKDLISKINGGLHERNTALKNIFKGIKKHVASGSDKYKVINKDGVELTAKEVADATFSRKAKLNSYHSMLTTLQNRVKLKSFDGYKLDLSGNTLIKFTGQEEDKTLFMQLTSEGMSNNGLEFKPLIVDGGSKLYNFIGGLRENNVKANNYYKYLRDNGVEGNKKIMNDLLSITEPSFKSKGLDKDSSLEQIGKALGLSDEIYITALNIGDKDGLGVGFIPTKEYMKGLSYEDFILKAKEDFNTRFKKVYQFKGKDATPAVIGKRISVLTHEDTSMTPGVNIKMFDYIVEELSVIETFLSKNRVDELKAFSDIDEKRILEILSLKEPTIAEKSEVVIMYQSNKIIGDTSIADLYSKTNQDIITAKYNYLTTANTDGMSSQHESINKLMGMYQGYVSSKSPVKYHYAELGKDLNKTLWSPYSDVAEKSLNEQYFKDGVNAQGYAIDATRLVGIESKKLGKGLYTKFEGDQIKMVADETGVKRRILGWREVESKYNRPASEEHYVEGIDITGITKQVTAQSHAVAKKFSSEYELFKIEELKKEITDIFNLGDELPISTRGDYNKFLSNIKNEMELENLGDTQRAYVQKKMKELLSFFEKPKSDSLGYRGKMLPRATYIPAGSKTAIPTKNDEVYVSINRYKDIIENSGTLSIDKIRDGKKVKEYYVTTYRSPVANFENVTLQRLVADETMLSDGVSAVSPFNANVLKQADFDGDTLNMVYIKPGVHAGGMSSALSFILKNEHIEHIDTEKIIRIMYNDELSFETKEQEVLKFIEEYIKGTNDMIMPSVSVAQVDVTKVKKTAEKLTDGEALLKANTEAIVGKDGIPLVSSATRTYTGLRDMAWEYKNNQLTGIDIDKLSELLSVNKTSQDFGNIIRIFDNLDLSNRNYSVDSASLNQQTLDAAKVGNMPDNWEETLREAGLMKGLSPDFIDGYLKSLATSYNSVYDGSKFFNYFKLYNTETKKIEITKVFDKTNYKQKTIFGNNTYLRDSIIGIGDEFDSKLAKGKMSYDEWYKQVEGIEVPDNRKLIEITKSALPEEDQWLAELVLYGRTAYKLDKVKVIKDTDGFPIGIDGEWSKPSGPGKGSYFMKATEGKPKIMANLSEKELRDMGVIFKSKKIDYYQTDYYYTNSYLNEIEHNFKGYNNKEQGEGIEITLPDSMKKADELINLLTDKLSDKGGFAKELDAGGIELDRELFNKELITKFIHAAKGSKLKDEYLKWVLSGHMFPSNVINKETNADLIQSSMVVQKEFLKENLNSPKVNEKIKEQFGDILESMGEFGEIESLKLSKDNLVITTISTDIEPMKVDLDGKLYDIGVVDNTIYIKDKTGDNLLKNSIRVTSQPNIINEFKSSPLTVKDDLMNELGVTTKDLRDKEMLIDQYLDDSYSVASLVNSKIAGKYFKKELLRNEHIAHGLTEGTYDAFNVIKKKYKNIDSGIARQIENLIYYGRNGDINTDTYKKFTLPLERDYIKDMTDFYNKWLAKHVSSKKINVPTGYMNGSVIADIVGLEIGRTEKLAFLEKGIFKLEGEKGFDVYARKILGPDYKEGKLLDGKTKIPRIVNDLYGGIYDINPLDGKWGGKLGTIRNTAFQVVYGSLSWFTHLGGLLIGTSQIPVEFLRTQSLTSKLSGFSNHKIMDSIMNKYGILHNVGTETAIRVGPQELNAPIVQKSLFTILDRMGAIIGINKNAKYVTIARRIAAIGDNPMLITDLVLDSARKRGAFSDTVYLLGFDNLKIFSAHLDSLDVSSRDALLAKIRLQSKNTYMDISGGVTAGSYLYRDSYLSRRLLPFNYLMGWGNRVASSALEDAGLFLKGMNKIIHGDIDRGFDLMFNKSKAMEKFVSNTIMTVGMYVKMNSRDDYTGEFEKRKSIKDFVMGMNANFIAIGMTFPAQILEAGINTTGGIEVRIANMINQTMLSAFRELDLSEMLSENMTDWLKGDRDQIIETILDAISTKAGKGLLYNKIISSEGIYGSFRERNDLDTALFLGIKAEDERVVAELQSVSSDEFLQALVDSGNHTKVLLEAIKSLPFVGLLLKNTSYGSYDVYETATRKFLDTLSSKEYNDVFLNMETALGKIEEGGYIEDLFKSLTSPTYPTGLNAKTEAVYKSGVQNLVEDMLVNVLREKHGSDYANIVYGAKDGGYEYMFDAFTESQAEVNQLMMKIASDSPAAAPYILAEVLKQEFYEYNKDMKAVRDVYGAVEGLTNKEQDSFKRTLMLNYEPLIRASASSEGNMAAFLAVSMNPDYLDTVLTSSGYVKDSIADNIMSQIIVSESAGRGDINPGYMTTRLGTMTNKFDTALANGDITEEVHKARLLNLYNITLDKINNANLSIDQKLELKTTALKSLGEHGDILEEDPELSKGFETSRVNLMHKMFSTIIDLKPLAERAKLDLAESTGRISTGSKSFLSSYKRKTPSFAKSLGSSIPSFRNTLNKPSNGFSSAFSPGRSGFNGNTSIRPLKLSNSKRGFGVEEFKKFLLEQKSLGLLRPTKKYRAPDRYIKVARAESIKVAQEPYLKPIFTKRTHGLLSNLPYNR